MTRIAHYVISTHWDREWYEPLQGFRMRLVSLLDEVFDTLERHPAFKVFTMDGQQLPGELGAPSSRAGFVCDLFGHISQLPQLFQQLGIPFAYIWRGTYEKE